jgi:hypothetical protein
VVPGTGLLDSDHTGGMQNASLRIEWDGHIRQYDDQGSGDRLSP